jgi:hypothetical protein
MRSTKLVIATASSAVKHATINIVILGAHKREVISQLHLKDSTDCEVVKNYF